MQAEQGADKKRASVTRLLLAYQESGGTEEALERLLPLIYDELHGIAHRHLHRERAEEIIALDAALDRLATFDERLSQVVQYRFFGGLTLEEIAELLSLSMITVHRDWKKAKAWLYHELR